MTEKNLLSRILTLASLLLLHLPATAEERIHDFHSDITVFENGEMSVTETITVNAEGNKIKRGIYRDFPTKYKDRFGNNYKVDFTVSSIQRDGVKESYHVNNMSNGVRIYIGQKDHYLNKGEYTYTISYRTNRQLGFFEQHDELYWNVTGNDWDFIIEKASATVHLPGQIPSNEIKVEAYTGATGSKGQSYRAETWDNTARFETTTRLPQRHGLTIVVGWPKGIVHEPTTSDKLHYLYKDNRHLLVATIGLLLVLIYYWLVWLKIGKDPKAGVIIAHYEPPDGFSPASMRFIEQMGYDKTCFASAIINLAVKGYLTIEEDNDGDYSLQRTGNEVGMAPGEKALVTKLFGSSKRIDLKQSNHTRIGKALDAHESSLEGNYEKIYFLTNTSWFILGLTITLVALLVVYFSQGITEDTGGGLFLMVWLTFWSLGVFAIVKTAWLTWCRATHHIINVFPAIFITLFAVPFIGAEIFVAWQLVELTSLSMVLVIIGFVVMNWLFYELLKAPTLAGRELLDKIEGFKQFIELAEKDELNYKHPLGRTPQLFEAYLPYALAMGVEQRWSEQFADVLSTATVAGAAYSPTWYRGSSWNNMNIGNFTSSLGSSFTSAIAASSTAPGSSSGGGGGGSSGGGGGGGGGGGW